MTDRRLDFAIEKNVARICMNRPQAANAIDLVFAKEFEAIAQECSLRRVRAVLLTANGRQFCGGGDLRSFAAAPDLSVHLEEVTRHLHSAIDLFNGANAPVVVAVRGAVAGAGFGLVCAADIVVSGESATFVMAYTRLGLTPDGSASWYLPQHIGLRRALDLTLTNRVLDAKEALDWGIISRLVADDQVLFEAEEIVEQIAVGPTSAFGDSKRLLRSATRHTLREHLDLESATQVARARLLDATEGVRGFVEKRSAHFVGE